MSVKFISDTIFDIYVKKNLIKNIDFSVKEDIEKYLKNLFKILKSKYNVAVEGFYDITVYIDKFYGIILHLEKEKIDYYDYYKNQVDMRLVTKNIEFMYEVDDIPKNILDKVKIYTKDNKIFLIIKNELTNLEMMSLLEFSKVVYS